MLRELGHLSRFYAVQSHLQTSTPLIPIVSHLLTAALIITHSSRMRHPRQYARMTLDYQTFHGLFCSTLPALLYNESCSCAFLTPTDGHHILYCTNLNNHSHEVRRLSGKSCVVNVSRLVGLNFEPLTESILPSVDGDSVVPFDSLGSECCSV